MSKKQKLELTWIGKDTRPKLRSLLGSDTHTRLSGTGTQRRIDK